MSDATTFVRGCGILPDGFVGMRDASWRLSTVLLLRHGEAIAFIQKSARDPAYAFGDAWALPGGMARLGHWDETTAEPDARAILANSMAARAEAEAGIKLCDCENFGLSDAFGPIVTSYVAKGATRFTLIGVHQASTTRSLTLGPGDGSVQNARWHSEPLPWESLAPANCVLVAHAVWSELEEPERRAADPAIDRALAQCRDWSGTMGWTLLPAPWASADELDAWRLSWGTSKS